MLRLKWRDCSGNYGPWKTKNGHFVYRLQEDLLTAHVGITRFEENKIEIFLEDKQGFKIKKKTISYKSETEVADKLEEAKVWAEKQMLDILEKNVKALRGV